IRSRGGKPLPALKQDAPRPPSPGVRTALPASPAIGPPAGRARAPRKGAKPPPSFKQNGAPPPSPGVKTALPASPAIGPPARMARALPKGHDCRASPTSRGARNVPHSRRPPSSGITSAQVADGDRSSPQRIVGQPDPAVRLAGGDTELVEQVREVLLDSRLRDDEIVGNRAGRRRLGGHGAGGGGAARAHYPGG